MIIMEKKILSAEDTAKQSGESEKINYRFKGLGPFFQSIVDQDRSSIVICSLNHEILYMNPAAISNYAKWGGEKLIGQSILDCHNKVSCEKMKQVVEWFLLSPENNRVYTFYNKKENKDVYMVALREKDELIGYYEKHEYRNRETMKLYDFSATD